MNLIKKQSALPNVFKYAQLVVELPLKPFQRVSDTKAQKAISELVDRLKAEIHLAYISNANKMLRQMDLASHFRCEIMACRENKLTLIIQSSELQNLIAVEEATERHCSNIEDIAESSNLFYYLIQFKRFNPTSLSFDIKKSVRSIYEVYTDSWENCAPLSHVKSIPYQDTVIKNHSRWFPIKLNGKQVEKPILFKPIDGALNLRTPFYSVQAEETGDRKDWFWEQSNRAGLYDKTHRVKMFRYYGEDELAEAANESGIFWHCEDSPYWDA